MIIKTYSVGVFFSNLYLVINEKTKECIMIDCGDINQEVDVYLEENNLKLKAILLTHGHFDHINGLHHYSQNKIPVYANYGDKEKITCEDLSTNIINLKLKPFYNLLNLNNKEELNIAGFKINVMHTPGHSKGSVCFIIEDNCIFTGDTLFKESFGRYDFNDSSYTELKNSLKELFRLKDYIVYPGHGESTTISYEKENNPIVYYL